MTAQGFRPTDAILLNCPWKIKNKSARESKIGYNNVADGADGSVRPRRERKYGVRSVRRGKGGLPVTIRESGLTEEVLSALIALSEDWEKEGSCYGYRANKREDIEGNRIFLAEEDERVVGYLFGNLFRSKNMRSVMPEDTPCFEVEELYVVPERRSRGVGRALFEFASGAVRKEAEYVVLSTAAKNWRAIFRFYLDEVGMEFWSARLFKRIGGDRGCSV